MKEENKMNKRTSIIIGVIVLLVLVIGASYAYFAVGTTNNFGTSTISATTDSVGTVTLSNINSTLYIDLTAADMMRSTSLQILGQLRNVHVVLLIVITVKFIIMQLQVVNQPIKQIEFKK